MTTRTEAAQAITEDLKGAILDAIITHTYAQRQTLTADEWADWRADMGKFLMAMHNYVTSPERIQDVQDEGEKDG